MVPLQRVCNNRMTSVIVVMFLVNIMLYAISFKLYTTQDQNRSNYIKDLRKNVDVPANIAARIDHLRDICLIQGDQPPQSLVESIFPGRTIVETEHRILYCPVQKVGSSFWKQTLKAMSSKDRVNSLYDMKRSKRRTSKLVLYQNLQKSSRWKKYGKEWFMQNATSFLVVRDPYTKLFSAYVDKLYHPNYLFWRTTGMLIEEKGKQRRSSICGNDVSFSDFIKYIITEANNGDKRLNAHFTPIQAHCHPCKTKYDFIMKFETFKADLNYLINKWNHRYNLNISFDDSEKDTALSIASKHINISFSTMKQFSKLCNIPIYNFLFRTWRFLQISGILPKEVEMPFSNDIHINDVTREIFLDTVKDVLSRDIDWTQVKKQRHEALVQAYQSIDVADIKKLREMVRPDCQYFDYDETPEYLFETGIEQFNYFDGIK